MFEHFCLISYSFFLFVRLHPWFGFMDELGKCDFLFYLIFCIHLFQSFDRVAQQCLHAKSCLQIIYKKQWPHNFPNLNPPCRYHVWWAIQEAFWKLHPSEAKCSFSKVALEKTWEFFPQNNISICCISKSVHTYRVCAISTRPFLISSKRQAATIKSSAVLSFLYLMQ